MPEAHFISEASSLGVADFMFPKGTLRSAKTKNHHIGGFCFGGEGGIRTLERFYPLHDFQSCALDQLSDFSVLLFVFRLFRYFNLKALGYYITVKYKCQHKFILFSCLYLPF